MFAGRPVRRTREPDSFQAGGDLFKDNSISGNGEGVTHRFERINQSVRESGITTAQSTPGWWTEDPDGGAVRIARGGKGREEQWGDKGKEADQ